MPEIAEVSVQVRYLQERCRGWKVKEWGKEGWSHFQNLPDDTREAQLADFFKDNVIEDITQRGKQVLLRTKNGVMASHLMFKGRWSLQTEPFTSNYKNHKEKPTDKSRSFWIINEDGKRLNFHDPEYKAKVTAYPGIVDPKNVEHLAKLGPEVIVTEYTDPSFRDPWEFKGFQAKMAKSKQAIKKLLLDQEKQSGLGNMYVCEALYAAGIAPERPANGLSSEELHKLWEASQEVVKEAMSTNLDYDKVLKIYRRKADPLGNPVTFDEVGGRDTFWVPAVQK